MELVPVSPSLTSMLRLASGVPNGTFSGMLTLKKAKLMTRKEKEREREPERAIGCHRETLRDKVRHRER